MATEQQRAVTVNGHTYDKETGLPITIHDQGPEPTRRPSLPPSAVSLSGVHLAPQRSQTLNRRVAQKATTRGPVFAPATAPAPKSGGRSMDIARSNRVSKFAPHSVNPVGNIVAPAVRPSAVAPTRPDHPAMNHPMVGRASSRPPLRAFAPKPAGVQSAPSLNPSSKDVKDAAIAKALAPDDTSKKDKSIKLLPSGKRNFFRRHLRSFIVVIVVIIVLGVGGYLTMMNLPILSVTFAANRAGINATYPSYVPDSYHLQQPVTFSDGEVSLKFASNNGDGGYTIKQARSSWDSSAVLTNVVEPAAGNNYITTQDNGLTIYTYAGSAAWVNAGILYTITNNGTLSNEQVDSIATSL